MAENTLHVSLKKGSQYSRLPRIVVMGVGGGGCNAINNMMGKKIEGVEFIAANTDIQSLANSKAERTIQLGKNTTKGQGAGSYPEIGLASAEEAREEIEEALKDAQLLFLTAGMGGGTGTGATPVIAKIAKEKDILTVAVVTKPFQYEAEVRVQLAEYGINELRKYVDTMIVLPNENLFRVANKETTLKDAFALSDNVLYLGVRGITDLITMPGLINLDFADVRMVIKKMGRAIMGMGEAEGDNRAIKAVEEALSNPLLEDINIQGATGALVNITGSPDITLFEFDEAAKRIREEIGGDKAIIKVGTAFMKELEGKVRVSIFATGIQEKNSIKYDEYGLDTSASSEFNKAAEGQNDDLVASAEINKTLQEIQKDEILNKVEASILKDKKEKATQGVKSRTRLNSDSSSEEDDFFDIGTAYVEDEENLEEKKSFNLFFSLFDSFTKKEPDGKKSDTSAKISSFKSKNKKIEFRENNSRDNIDEKSLNIPAYLRNKK